MMRGRPRGVCWGSAGMPSHREPADGRVRSAGQTVRAIMPSPTDEPAPASGDALGAGGGDERGDGGATAAEPRPSAGGDEITLLAPRPAAPRTDAGTRDGTGEERGRAAGAAGRRGLVDDVEVVDLAARYTILGPLGQGGMGTVLLALDNRLGRRVAIKRIGAQAVGSRTAVARFLGEARAIAALNHPNIVQIYDYGRAVDGPFLVMEYVDGGSLLDRCKAGPIPAAEAIGLACRICDGLAEAHDQQIIHRDIKPANVLLSRDDVPKLTDFGLAKMQADEPGHSITAPGVVLGTADFMPPEQRRSADLVDHRSDLWSLAATVYQMVTGRSPRIIRIGDVPLELQAVLARALEDDKEARYQSARQLRDAFETSLRSAKRPPPAVVVAGQCPTCGIANEPGRKFCRRCAGSLEAACLACGQPLPIREEICGACGARQTPLVEAKRDQMALLQARAEGLLGDLEFDQATEVAAGLRGTADLRVGQIDAWVEAFLETIDAERERRTAEAVAALRRAAEHERAHDHAAAARELGAVPRALRDSVLPEARETVAAALSRIHAVLDEIRRLESRIRAAGGAPDDDRLFPDVERLLTLAPHSPGVKPLHDGLLERRRRRERACAVAVAKATDLFARSRYEAALATLASVPGAASPEVIRLRARSEQAAAARTRALAALAAAGPGTHAQALAGAAAYRSMLVAGDATDAEFSAALRSVERARADEKTRATRRRRLALAAGLAATAVVIVATGLGVRASLRTAAASRAREADAIAALPATDIVRLPPIVNSIGMPLKLVPAGTFTMGDPLGDGDERPRRVTLAGPYFIGVAEVTNAQWARVMGGVPSRAQAAEQPVENVSWDDAVEFCRRLSALPAERRAGRSYRLPTEAEWEHACRSGTTTAYAFGDDDAVLGDYGWFDGNSGDGSRPVGTRRANAWGLFDMHGNVWEWCAGRGDGDDRGAGDLEDPSAAAVRVYRGGSWSGNADYCRSFSRLSYDRASRFDFIGFRVALSPSAALLLETAGAR